MTVIVSPEGVRAALERSLAPRPATLEGLTVGLLDNNKPGAGPLLEGIRRGLAKHGVAGSIYRRKAHPSGPSPYVEEVAGTSGVAISAIGD